MKTDKMKIPTTEIGNKKRNINTIELAKRLSAIFKTRSEKLYSSHQIKR